MAVYDDEGHYMGEGDEGDFDLSEGFDMDPLALAALVGMGGASGMFGGEELVSSGEDDDVEPESWAHEDDGKPAPVGLGADSGVRDVVGMELG